MRPVSVTIVVDFFGRKGHDNDSESIIAAVTVHFDRTDQPVFVGRVDVEIEKSDFRRLNTG